MFFFSLKPQSFKTSFSNFYFLRFNLIRPKSIAYERSCDVLNVGAWQLTSWVRRASQSRAAVEHTIESL